jgi:hypothetical protein
MECSHGPTIDLIVVHGNAESLSLLRNSCAGSMMGFDRSNAE